jgi:hypothetical protein
VIFGGFDGCGDGSAAGDGADGGYRPAVGTKAERRAARTAVAGYHEARLGELIEYIAIAIDRYRAGEVDAYTVDETIHHYYRAARELWKFCWSGGGGTHIEMIAHVLDRMTTDGETINWWERVSPRQPD